MFTSTLWRVFPWDPQADPGAPFSSSYLPIQSGHGRFDLARRVDASAWYFAEAPEHAVAERIQDLRNRRLFGEALFERGRRLALVAVEIRADVIPVDLCDPAELARRRVAPDRLAFPDRAVTQQIAADLHADGTVSGLRWWSAFFGEWHTTVLFSDRIEDGDLVFGKPEELRLDTPAVMAATVALGIEIE